MPEPRPGADHGSNPSIEDRFVGRVLDDDFDWVDVVRRYPLPALAVSAFAGFWIGREHGFSLLSALGDAVSERVTQALDDSLGRR